MIKLIYCFSRKLGMTVEEFQKHWFETHGPIAAKIPGVRRYVQSHVPLELYQGDAQPAYDGAAEVWFDDLASMRKAFASPEVAVAREDELLFIDHSKSVLFFAEEKVIVG